jgi:GNAT superfamily N-acetyltransferase
MQDRCSTIVVASSFAAQTHTCLACMEGRDYLALRGPAGVLYDPIVDPLHRGLGIGRMLLEVTLAPAERGAPLKSLSISNRTGHRRAYREAVTIATTAAADIAAALVSSPFSVSRGIDAFNASIRFNRLGSMGCSSTMPARVESA